MSIMYEKQAADLIAGVLKKDKAEILRLLEKPPNHEMGDIAFPCFALSKKPNQIALELAESISPAVAKSVFFEKAEAKGPYLNLFVSLKAFAKDVLTGSFKQHKKHGKVMVEYSQVNTHKSFHVGHLRGTLLGQALVNIMRFDGYKVISANYQGDIGAHVAKVIWYLTHHNKEEPADLKGTWLGGIYKKANSLVSEKPEYAKEVQEVLRKLEDGDEELTKLWKKTRQWSLDEFAVVYSALGITFDEYFFESEVEKQGKAIVEKLKKKGIAKMSEGAVIVDLESYGLGVFLVLKKDGTSLYATKDLALAEHKFSKFRIDKSIYCTGAEQVLYFQQLFKTLELMGSNQAKNCVHLPYGLVMLEGGKISSREGELLTVLDFISQVKAVALQEVSRRHKDWDQVRIDASAVKVTMAGIKFSMLNQDNNKPINFNVERAVEFEGETGPYVQYAHARICSILRKNTQELCKVDYSLLEKEKPLLILLSEYPLAVSSASDHNKPAILARYLLLLSQAFNEYYHSVPILKAEPDQMKARLFLIDAVRRVLSSGLSLLGIESPDEM